MPIIVSAFLGIALSLLSPSAFGPMAMPVSDWEALEGDRFLVDTKLNIGYIFHLNGAYTSFPLATGQRRVVRYIGLVYDATTPENEWIVKTRHVKGDRITYGPSGRFMRLYKDGEEYSHYGIHTHAYGKQWLADEDRYKSMGCVVVSEEVYDMLEKAYELNGEKLEVVTTYGIDKFELVAR